jgi:hypothetical protein
MWRTISATTTMSDASGTPALTVSKIIDGRSGSNIVADSVMPKPCPCKPTLKAKVDRKFSIGSVIRLAVS